MDALQALLGRRSASRLVEPAPAGVQRERILRSALQAPDHARLRPWRFLLVEGDARQALGEAMARAMRRHDPQAEPATLEKLRANPLRAPLVVVLLACIREHPKVPALEQQLSVACAAQCMLLAAHAEGFGGIWRTGPVTWLPELPGELGLLEGEQVLGFLYIGTPASSPAPVEPPAPDTHFRKWPDT
ncbi:MAG: nitroreductase family protein [Gammaproteobacteria bacterium]